MWYNILILILILIVCFLLILTVLAQNPKGGMAANFGVSNQVMGARQTTDILEKATWGFAVTLLVLCLAATMTISSDKISASKSAIDRAIQENAASAGLPNQMTLPTADIVDETAAPAADATAE